MSRAPLSMLETALHPIRAAMLCYLAEKAIGGEATRQQLIAAVASLRGNRGLINHHGGALVDAGFITREESEGVWVLTDLGLFAAIMIARAQGGQKEDHGKKDNAVTGKRDGAEGSKHLGLDR